MATFHIHQDSEKENPGIRSNVPGAGGKLNQQQHHHQKHQELKDKRPTLAVINNIGGGINRIQNQGKTVLGKPVQSNKILQQKQQKKIVKSVGNVNVVDVKKKITENQQQLSQATTKSSFAVYEDGHQKTTSSTITISSSTTTLTTKIPVKDDKKDKDDAVEKITHILEKDNKIDLANNAIRDPLKEICNDGLIETPMSVSGTDLSPMSVDKSILNSSENIENLPPSNIVSSLLSKPIKENDDYFETSEYQVDILDYFRELEKKHRPKPNYMNKQPDINYSMRTILVDWLVEVAEEYRLHHETLYLAISYIDRFLSYMSVVRAKLQLVGTSAMFIASKYEEIYPPDVSEFVFITDDTYTKSQVLRMEQIILKILSFDLNVPSTYSFMNMYSVLYKMPDQVIFFAIYLSELTLLEGEPYLQYLPSQIASASLALARFLLDFSIWCPELEEVTKYDVNDLKGIILHICNTHNLSFTLPQQAIREKYKSSRYMQVANIKSVEINQEQLDYIIEEYNQNFKKSENITN